MKSVARLSRTAAIIASAALFAACAGERDQTEPRSVGSTVLAVKSSREAPDSALRRLVADTGDATIAAPHKATGATRFLQLGAGSRAALDARSATGADKAQRAAAFFREYGNAVGASGATLRLVSSDTDGIGQTHLTYEQLHGPFRVFGARIKVHFDAADRLSAVIGTVVPDVQAVSLLPAWSSARAGSAALAAVAAARGHAGALRTDDRATLYVYREGLAQGVPGPSHLAWEIVVSDGAGIRDFVYVSALTGKVIDRISAVQDAMFRRAYNGNNLPRIPTKYPNGVYWQEGDKFPTNVAEANNMIIASKETYDFFFDTFERDSFDGNGGIMDAIFNRGYDCPNASWNGTFISFCPGLTVDDVTTHEWGHAYTQYTHGLIYAWQPGALNEAYSDIWGETVDLINGRGLDSPGGGRAAEACSTFSPPVGKLTVNSPAAIAGDYFAQSALFGAPLSATGITGSVVAALDPADVPGPSTLDGCSPLTNAAAVAGNVALINRGTCEFSTKVLNAQNAGAIAVIIANNAPTGLPGMGPGVVAAQVTISSVGVQQGIGNAIRAELAAAVAVNATLKAAPGTDASVRWLLGEESTGLGGALRDMANPTCYSNPGKVSDTAYYVCAATDNGGVHTNSGVPNHGYELLVDGGAYNGRTVAAIGLSKAADIYFRAQTVYQVFDSDFEDHANALTASCADLVGETPEALAGDELVGPITDSDCAQVAEMIAAVELRGSVAFCNFPALLNPGIPAQCNVASTDGTPVAITSFDFETDPTGSWTVGRASTSPSFTARDWMWVDTLPPRPVGFPAAGHAFFGPTPDIGTCLPGDDQSGVLTVTSPEITLPPSTVFARASFDHWFAMEPGIDGGNLSISVNGGPFQLVPPSEVAFNQYIALLFTAADGNTNPLAGQPAWTSTRAGEVTQGSWGRTLVNLGNFAGPGSTIRLRWNVGTDGCAGRTGWYLDNVNVFSCTPKVPTISVADLAIVEGDSGRSNATFVVRLSTPTINTIAVAFTTADGTATGGNDYDPAAGQFLIPAGVTTVGVPVSIKGDTAREGPETFFLRLVAASNATIGDGEAVGTIGEDDVHP